MVDIYGIKNCDTMKKAFKWLTEQGIDYDFHDYKKQGIDRDTLETWETDLGWEQLLNRRGMLWRKVPDDMKANIDRESAIRLMLDTPSIIKRPLLDTGSSRHVGFKPQQYEAIFSERGNRR